LKRAREFYACLIAAVLCAQGSRAGDVAQRDPVLDALRVIGLDEAALSVPRAQKPAWKAGRLAIVDGSMARPLSMRALSRRLLERTDTASMSDYLTGLLELGGIDIEPGVLAGAVTDDASLFTGGDDTSRPVLEPELDKAVTVLLQAAVHARQVHAASGGAPSTDELALIRDHLANSISFMGEDPQMHWLTRSAYHDIGARVDMPALAAGIIRLLAVTEGILPLLGKSSSPTRPIEWETPDGRVRIAGRGNDRHTGEYLLLIDLGGDDRYDNVGYTPEPGKVSLVIDLDGNDTVRWESVPGPGAGILGMGLWVDLAGNDVYDGRNLGLGSALLGAGIFWDRAGNDEYRAGALVQGAGQYGIGILIDGGGDDVYAAALSSQGYAGPGGVGLQVDLDGNDSYRCGGRYADVFEARVQRNGEHFLSLCQGYSFGVRPRVSGGLGLLLDRRGNDDYQVDLFGQGASLWFGLGMLADGGGDDHYQAFEHAQGEGLHMSAGFLGDWSGNDRYDGYEHCQGVGVDRAAGYLYDHAGDDVYLSHHNSQGAGLKPFGVGLLVDRAGDDRYSAAASSQGYTADPGSKFPERQWPAGVLLDLGGKDGFDLPGVAVPDAEGRIQNRQGVAVKR